jgi:hypothetical protein
MFTGGGAQVVPGAQGMNIMLDLGQILIPTAQAHAYNMNVASRGVRGPTGGG